MCFINKSIKMAQNLNVWEISFFKLYLVAVTFILSIWFPIILTASVWLYIIVFVVLLLLSFGIMIKQQGNFYKTIFTKWFWVHIFEKMWIFDIGIFKLTIVSAGLLLAKLFPVLLTADIARYIAIACLFIWYYFHWLFYSK